MNHYYINDLMKTINFKKKRFFSPDMKCEGLQQLWKINENNLNCEESKSTQISQCKISKSINSTTKNKDETNSIGIHIFNILRFKWVNKIKFKD